MDDLTACHDCDLLIKLPEHVAGHQKVSCPRCRKRVLSGHKNPVDYVLALSCSAIIILLMANSFPFLSFSAQGQSQTMSLFQASAELFQQGFYLLSILVFCFIIFLPFVYLILLVLLLLPMKWGKKRVSSVHLGKLISGLLPWVMAEVFMVGVLVALIKIVAIASVVLGISFWAYIIFTLLFVYIASVVDNKRLWTWVEHGQ